MNAYYNDSIANSLYLSGQKIWTVYKGSALVWKLNKVSFVDWDGTQLKYQEVVTGNPATAPTAPTREGYDFTGWSSPYDNITQDTAITAQYVQSTITEVSYDIVDSLSSQTKATINYQNHAYGFMYWSGSDLPVWQASLSNVFNTNSIGGSMTSQSGVARGYNGTTMSFTSGGRGGIALSSIDFKTAYPMLITKVRIQPGIVVKAESSGGSINTQEGWEYSDASTAQYLSQRLGMCPQSLTTTSFHTPTALGYSTYTRGRYLQVKMRVYDSNKTRFKTFSLSTDLGASYSQSYWWYPGGALSPTIAEFDFAQQIIDAGLKKDAKTAQLKFLQSTSASFSSAYPAAVNAVRVYKDSLNGA